EKVDKWRVEKLRGGGQESIAIYRPEAYGKYMGPHEVEAFVLAEALETRARAIVEAHGARNTEVTHSRQQRAEVADARDFDSKDGGAFTRRSDSNRRRLGSSHEPPPPKPPSEKNDDWVDSPTTASGSSSHIRSDEPIAEQLARRERELSGAQADLITGSTTSRDSTRVQHRRPKAGPAPDRPKVPAPTAEPSRSDKWAEPTHVQRLKAGPGEPSA